MGREELEGGGGVEGLGWEGVGVELVRVRGEGYGRHGRRNFVYGRGE